MLTGDNGYTARTVAINCGLINADVKTLSIKSDVIPEQPNEIY